MITIDTDQPKYNSEEDRFQRYGFAGRVANIVMNNDLIKSLVIGIYGKWGEGKTSVINFIKKQLPQDVVIVNFNPWLFSSEEQLIHSFFSSLAFELDLSLENKKEKVGKVLSDYGQAIGSVTSVLGFSFDGVKEIGDKLQNTSIEKLKARVDDMIRKTGKKIVVCVDDIDRLDVKEIQYIFKLIKLVGDFPGTTYILAFDDEMVAGALAPQYGNRQAVNGYAFLEKIIQLPLKIPKATRVALKKYVLDMLGQVVQGLNITVTQDELNEFRSVFDEYYVPHIDNPRLASRFTNAVHFALPLLYGEVNTNELILLEGIKVLFPTAYDFTRQNSVLFLTDTSTDSGIGRKKYGSEQILKEINLFLESLSDVESKAVKEIWKQLFPQYRHTSGSSGFRDTDWKSWYKEKRICSGTYFERYFTYVVLDGDISDVMFQGLLSDLESLPLEECEEKLAYFFEQNAMSDIIFKLRLWEDSLNNIQSRNLAKLIARKGKELPMEAGEFASYTTNAEGAKTIAQLMLNIPSHDRKTELLALFKETDNLEFSMEVFYWLMYKNEKSGDIISESDQKELELALIYDFKEQLKKKVFFDILPDSEAWRLLSWWSEIDSKDLQSTVVGSVSNLVKNVMKLIKIFTPTIVSFGGAESRTFKSNFNSKNYASMKKTIDIVFAYNILAKSYTERTAFDLNKIPDHEALTDDQLVNIFMQFFEQEQFVNPLTPDSNQDVATD
jgi:hypothetical protein